MYKATNVVVLLVFLHAADVAMDLVMTPNDTAALSGQQVRLNCSSGDDQNDIFWQRNPNAVLETVATGCAVRAGYESQYDVDKSLPDHCDLVVFNNGSTSDIATEYRCNDFSTAPTVGVVNLIVLERCPSGAQSLWNVANEEPGKTVTFSCWVYYDSRDATVAPSLHWAGSGVQSSFNATNVFIELTVNTQDQITIPPQTCYVSASPSFVFDFTCSGYTSTAIIVSSGASNFSISAVTNNSHIATLPVNITCLCDAHPTPTFSWNINKTMRGSSNISTAVGATYTLTENGYYEMIRNQIIFSDGHTEERTRSALFVINAIDATTAPHPSSQIPTASPNATSTASASSADSSATESIRTASIVLAVLFGVAFLALVLTWVYVVYLKRQQKAKKYRTTEATVESSQQLSAVRNRHDTATTAYAGLDVSTHEPHHYQPIRVSRTQTGNPDNHINVTNTSENTTGTYAQLSTDTQRPIVYDSIAAQ